MPATSRHATLVIVAVALILSVHIPFIGLPYFWDEAGYYIPASLDIYQAWEFVPTSTLPTGHPPLVMTYLALAWRLFGFSPVVTRVAMVLFAAATVTATYALARRVLDREPAAWTALLLAVSPMFFAQSTLVFLDLPAALFTTLAVLALVEDRWWKFSLMASLVVLTKETAVVMLPVVWVWAWGQSSGRVASTSLSSSPAESPRVKVDAEVLHSKGREKAPPLRWIAMLVPVLPLVVWTIYYHHRTGFWTGNAEYLQYNLYTTLDPARFFWTLLRRLYEVFIGGFNWLLLLGAAAGFWWGKRNNHGGTETRRLSKGFIWLTSGLLAVYVLMLSVVGGAVLPRYLLPVFPVFFVACAALIWRLPKVAARSFCGAAATCFVAAWFINPPYPFAYESNLAYADFIRLHQDAARYLESRPPGERILTAWPATDELSRPFLGYVTKPLRVVPLREFRHRDFDGVPLGSFDIVYLYARKWEPPNHWLARWGWFRRIQMHHFNYEPPAPDRILAVRLNLKLLQEFHRRGQWVRIYAKQEAEVRTQTVNNE